MSTIASPAGTAPWGWTTTRAGSPPWSPKRSASCAAAGVYTLPRRRARASTRNSRLRLVYEANPIAFLMEQAGGAATNGVERILDLQPATLHGRVPLVFGSRDQVGHVSRYHTERSTIADRSPLFNRRSVLRA